MTLIGFQSAEFPAVGTTVFRRRNRDYTIRSTLSVMIRQILGIRNAFPDCVLSLTSDAGRSNESSVRPSSALMPDPSSFPSIKNRIKAAMTAKTLNSRFIHF